MLIKPTTHFLPALLLVSLLAGCGSDAGGPQRSAIEGHVTLAGEPLPAGTVAFIPAEPAKGPTVFATIREGHYQLSQAEGPVLGPHRVEINPSLGFDPAAGANDREVALTEHLRANGPIVPPVRIPEKYNRRSLLTAVVTENGANTFDFPLDREISRPARGRR
jgi:hypothetical protein